MEEVRPLRCWFVDNEVAKDAVTRLIIVNNRTPFISGDVKSRDRYCNLEVDFIQIVFYVL